MELIQLFSRAILSSQANIFLGLIAFVLVFLYLSKALFVKDLLLSTKKARRSKLAARALNWGIFALVFVFFDMIVGSFGFPTWRATARISLFFLMASEIACNIDGFKLLKRELKKCKLIQSFQSLLP